MDIQLLLSLLAVSFLSQVESQFVRGRGGRFGGGNNGAVNAGRRNGFGSNRGLSRADRQALNLAKQANRQGLSNQADQVAIGNQVAANQGLAANNFLNAQEVRDIDVAHSLQKGNKIALAFEAENFHNEGSAFSLNEGSSLNQGNQLQAVDNFAQENLLNANSIGNTAFIDQNNLGLFAGQQNNIGISDSLFGQDGSFLNAQNNRFGFNNNFGGASFKPLAFGKRR